MARHEMALLVYNPTSPRKMNLRFITWHSKWLAPFFWLATRQRQC